jgi:hypothetical protein
MYHKCVVGSSGASELWLQMSMLTNLMSSDESLLPLLVHPVLKPLQLTAPCLDCKESDARSLRGGGGELGYLKP